MKILSGYILLLFKQIHSKNQAVLINNSYYYYNYRMTTNVLALQ